MNTTAVKAGNDMKHRLKPNPEKARRMMNQRNKIRMGVITSALLLSSAFYGTLFSSTVNADLIDDIEAGLRAAGVDQGVIDTIPWQRAKAAVNAAMANGREWGEAAFRDVLRIAEETSVRVDALIPSVQGCIKETDGRPLVSATVVGIGLMPGTIGSLAPMIATTSGEGIPATVFGVPINPQSHLSESQQASWGAGCYWLPVPPGWADAVSSIGSQRSHGMMRVIPMVQGYEMSPVAKYVFTSGNGEASVSDMNDAFELNPSGETVETTAD